MARKEKKKANRWLETDRVGSVTLYRTARSPYREFLIPADIVNRYRIRECTFCQTCDSEYGGQHCWWCEANRDKWPCSMDHCDLHCNAQEPQSIPQENERKRRQGQTQQAVDVDVSPTSQE